MRYNDAAVGGFFEDLPVLVLVLGGVATIIAASVWSSSMISNERLDEELQEIVERFADRVVEAMLETEGLEYPTVEKLRMLNISRLAAGLPEGLGYAVSMARVYPSYEVLLQRTGSDKPVSGDACACSRLTNALDAESRVVIVELRVVVW